MNKKQGGFTLIELVLVIVILGILAATALPRFFDMSTDARKAALNGMAGAMRSAANLARAAQLAQNLASNSPVDLEGAPGVTMSGGYPTADGTGIIATLQDTSGFSVSGATLQLTNAPTPASCSAAYSNTGTGSFTVNVTETGC